MLKTFIANLKKAIRDQETVSIGGGLFSGSELKAVLTQLTPPQPSGFKTTLFKLLNSDALIIVDGYEIETVNDMGADEDGNTILRCSCDEYDWSFIDQTVDVNQEGGCMAKTIAEEDGPDCDVLLEFRVTRPITESDL